MSPLEQLLNALAQKPSDVRADFVGHLVMNVVDEVDVAALPKEMRADLERFIDRAGFAEGDTDAATRARIDAHFSVHALDADLVRLLDALEGAIAATDAAQAGDQARAASEALGGAASLRPVGAGGRQPGTLAGGLMGLVTARTLSKAVAALPAAPKTGFSR